VILLDSSAVLAMLQGEPGTDRVVSALTSDAAAISAANLAEVLSILAVRGGVALDEARMLIRRARHPGDPRHRRDRDEQRRGRNAPPAKRVVTRRPALYSDGYHPQMFGADCRPGMVGSGVRRRDRIHQAGCEVRPAACWSWLSAIGGLRRHRCWRLFG
jgi:hypothetical protein